MQRAGLNHTISRRQLLVRLGALGLTSATATVLAACQPPAPTPAPAKPTAAPAKPVEAAKPVEPAKPAEAAKPVEAAKPAGPAPGAPTVAPAAAPKAAGPSGELRIAYGAIGPNRHPHYTTALPDDDIANLIFDALVTQTDDGKLTGVAAAKWDRVTDTQWRFTLKPGIKFQDGAPLTSADAKFTLDHPPDTVFSQLYRQWLDKTEIVDEQTFDIFMKTPFRPAFSNMAFQSYVIPKTATDAKAFGQQLVGSGPYKFVEFVPNQRVVVEANTAYWGTPKPQFERITLRQITENSTRMAALEAGEIDFATNVPPDAINRLKGAGFQVSTVPLTRSMYVAFNLSQDGPWKDPKVRQALNYAIDKEGIRTALLDNLGAVLAGPVQSASKFFNKALKPYPYDPPRARELLAEAGLRNGFESTVVSPDGRLVKDREIAEAVVGQLEAVGVKLKLVPLEWATFLKERATYPLVLTAWGNPQADAAQALRPFDPTEPVNFAKYANPEILSLMEQGRTTFDEAKAQAAYDKAQELLVRDAPWLYLFELPDIVAYSSKFAGFAHRSDEMKRWHFVTRKT